MSHPTRLRDRLSGRAALSRGRGGAWDAAGTPGVLDALLLLGLALRRACGSTVRRGIVLADRLAVPIGLLILLQAYLATNSALPTRPHGLNPAEGWWAWYDQGKTLEALRGWRMHHPDASNQWYQPLYPLLGALGMALSPRQPFLLVDLACLLASFLLFVPLARLMGVGRLVAVALFLLVTAGEAPVIANWVIPWNTSGSTPLLLLGLLAAARLVATRPLTGRATLGWSAAFGAAAGLIPAFRPTDTMELVPAALVVAAILSLRPDLAPRDRALRLLRIGAGGLAGFLPALAVTAATYLPVFGLHPSPYMTMSGATGFDPQLLALHWVTLVVGARPLIPGGTGLVEVFWWLAPALAGIVAALLAGCLARPVPSARPLRLPMQMPVHLIVLGGIVPHWCLYLSYRDLHPPGLWAYNNFHYFIWTLPLLSVYAALLLALSARALLAGYDAPGDAGRRIRAVGWPVAAGLLVMVLAFCWRPQLGPWTPPAGTHPAAPSLDLAGNRVLIPGGLDAMHDALLVAARDRQSKIYFGDDTLDEGGRLFHHFTDFRAFPLPGGMMVLPLRSLPPGDGALRIDPMVRLDASHAPVMMRQDLVFGLPCWVPRRLRAASCAAQSPLPGPIFPGRQIDFDGKMEPAYLIPGGWTDQSDGRWTLGYTSSLQFRVPNWQAIGQGVTIEVEGAGFIPRGADWLAIAASANGTVLTRWIVSTTREVALRVSVPASLIPADGQIRLTLSALNARSPADVVAGATDRRLLGFRVRAIRLLPWSPEVDAAP